MLNSHKAFDLVKLIDKLPLNIECMTCFDNKIILGTNCGNFLIYEMKMSLKNELIFERRISVGKKPILQLEVAHNIIIALFNAELHVFDLNCNLKYSINKTKGCSLFATSISSDQKELRLCVVNKKRLQFFYIHLIDEKTSQFMELVSDLELNDTPRNIIFTKDDFIIFSLQREYYYCYYKIPSVYVNLYYSSCCKKFEPLCEKLHDEHFVINIDENKMNIYDSKSKPISIEKPVQWSHSTSNVCNLGPFLIGVLPTINSLEITTIQPKSLSVQIIDFGQENTTTDRIKLLKSNNNLEICYVASQSNLWCLIPIKIEDQLEKIMESKNYELGLILISQFENLTQIDQITKRRIENLNALDLFRKKKFNESFQLFQEMRIDPSHCVALLPGPLPYSYRKKLKIEGFYPILDAKELNEANISLVHYLLAKRKQFLKENKHKDIEIFLEENAELIPLYEGAPVLKTYKQILKIIDTTILKCYLVTKEFRNLVPSFLRLEPLYLHFKQSEDLLIEHKKLNELIILYEKKQEHEKALNLLLIESIKHDSSLYGLKHLVEYLKKLGNENLELIFKFARNVIETDLEMGIKIFMGDALKLDQIICLQVNKKNLEKSSSNNDYYDFKIIEDDCDYDNLKLLDREQVSKYLKSFNLDRLYLQYCIFVWNDSSLKLNNILIDLYLIDSENFREILIYFLSETNYYDLEYAISKLNLENFPKERAIVLGKLGKHQEVLTIYVEKLNDTNKAEAYCNQVFCNYKDIYYELLKIYLKSDDKKIKIDASIRLLNENSTEISSCRLLELLPDELIKFQNLSPFFENMLNRLYKNKHSIQIIKRLMFSLELQIHETKIFYKDKYFIVKDEQLCKKCNKRIGKSVIVRFPNGDLMHYSCSRNSEVY
jgi:Vam6/Vps39-like protein vacuolar protein sorting-associated protein 39